MDKKNIIIIVVIVLVICCCCSVAGIAWQFGDAIKNALMGG
jgi:hypothetical protein